MLFSSTSGKIDLLLRHDNFKMVESFKLPESVAVCIEAAIKSGKILPGSFGNASKILFNLIACKPDLSLENDKSHINYTNNTSNPS